ncbi:MAG: CCA-adding enzyme [Candidatus Latescibacteria bacterium ADurb.Bin168]|nr:MAG: CCA-adding enzyme [Candidatus Latescibacteria bacterium ADurb.Bin168]
MEQLPLVISPPLSSSHEFAAAADVIRTLHAAGYNAYLIGGCVRDMVLGLIPKDFDIVTSAKPEETQALFPRSLRLGAQFGVITVLANGLSFDVATFRREGNYEDGRRPSWVEYADLEADVRRRDFTINGMAFDLSRSTVIDLCGGLADLREGIIRTIGDPAERFGEDALRVIRAVRFAARFGFSLEETTRLAVISAAPSLGRIARERIWQELQFMITEERRESAFSILAELGLLPHVFGPDAVWSPETIVRTSARLAALAPDASIVLVLACVLADGVAHTTPDEFAAGVGEPYDEEAASRAETVLVSLRAPRSVVDGVGALIARRMVWAAPNSLREGRIAQLVRNDRTGALVPFWTADAASFGMADAVSRIRDIADRIIAEGKAHGGKNRMPLNGTVLADAGIPRDATMGELLAEAERLWLEGKLETEADVRRWLNETVRRADSGAGAGDPKPQS